LQIDFGKNDKVIEITGTQMAPWAFSQYKISTSH
jgi:hypothetical protein